MTLLAGSEIGRLRTAARHDTPRLRGAVEARVRAAEIRPAALPPAAVLVARHVGVAPALTDRAWDRACRERLAEVAAGAARPVRGVIPDGAEAVLFRDEAELLACLALDVARGVAARRWWWRLLLPRFGTAPVAVLSAQPESTPAALALLDGWSAAHPVVAALAPHEVAQLLRSLAVAHAALPVAAVADAISSPSVACTPGQARRALLAVALRLHARPEEVRAGRAVRDVLAGLAAVAGAPATETSAGGVATRAYGAATSATAAATRADGAAPSRADGLSAAPSEAPPPQRAAHPLSGEARSVVASAGASPEAAELPRPRPTAPADRASETPAAAGGATATTRSPADTAASAAPPPHAASPSAPPERVAPRIWEDGVPTALGGVFALVHVIERLELPGDDDIGPWGVLEALARGLLDEVPDDALWALLAEIAGREPHAPLRAALWLADTLPAVRAWLAETLEVDDPVAELLVRSATVHATRTHVDVVMALDAISLPVRRAGLDADPGWLPSYGRVVRFHYEDRR